jgi:hypothetical protein
MGWLIGWTVLEGEDMDVNEHVRLTKTHLKGLG